MTGMLSKISYVLQEMLYLTLHGIQMALSGSGHVKEKMEARLMIMTV
jgi:hypothetical protein